MGTRRVVPELLEHRRTARKARWTMPTRLAIDEHIGLRLRKRRRFLGLSQMALGNACGVRFQQIQKYESADNPVSAARLWLLALATDTPVDYFFEGLIRRPRRSAEAVEVARTFSDLDEGRRRQLLQMVRSLQFSKF